MSIDNVGDSTNPPFIPPDEEKKDQETHEDQGNLGGHNVSLQKRGLSKSLPDLSKIREKETFIKKASSDSDLKEHIYDVPRDFSPKEPIYDVVKPPRLKEELLENLEEKVEEASSFLQQKESHYDYVRKPGESTSSAYVRKLREDNFRSQVSPHDPMEGTSSAAYDHVRSTGENLGLQEEEEHVYESLEDVLTELKILESLERNQSLQIRELSDSVAQTLEECMTKCEEIFSKDQTQQAEDDPTRNKNFSQLLSRLQSAGQQFFTRLSAWKENFNEQFNSILLKLRSVKEKQAPSSKQNLLRFSSQSMSAENKERLLILAENRGIKIEFEESSEGDIIIVKSSSPSSSENEIKEKFEDLLSLLSSSSQDFAKEETGSELNSFMESFLSFLESSSKKLQDLINKQKESIRALVSKSLKRSYSLSSLESSNDHQESYKKLKSEDSDEKDDKL